VQADHHREQRQYKCVYRSDLKTKHENNIFREQQDGSSGTACAERHFADEFLPFSIAKRKQEEASAFDYDAESKRVPKPSTVPSSVTDTRRYEVTRLIRKQCYDQRNDVPGQAKAVDKEIQKKRIQYRGGRPKCSYAQPLQSRQCVGQHLQGLSTKRIVEQKL